MAGDYEELKAVLQELLTNRFAPKPEYTRGLLGDGQGNVVVANNPDRNYARFNRGSTEYFEIFNVTVPPVDGWPILIGELPWLPGLTQVVGTDWAAYEQSGWGDSISSTSPHAPTHEWPNGSPGADPVSVYMRSIVPLRGYTLGTGSTTFYANSYEYENANGSGSVWGGLPGVDLQPVMASLATGTAKLMGVYLDPVANTLAVITGTTDIFTDASDPPAPSFPSSSIPVARVRVYGGQSSIGEIDIRDARRPFGLSGGGSGFLRADGTIIGATSQAQDFGENGIKANNIAESDALNGIIVDGNTSIKSQFTPLYLLRYAAPTGSASGFYSARYRGTAASPADVQSGDVLFDHIIAGQVTSDKTAAIIRGVAAFVTGSFIDGRLEWQLYKENSPDVKTIFANDSWRIEDASANTLIEVDLDTPQLKIDTISENTAAAGITASNDILSAVSLEGIADWPLIDTANTSGVTSHFRDNDSSYPAGWTETDAANESVTNDLYSFWRLQGTSVETSWKYRIQTSITLESITADDWASFQVGPLYVFSGLFAADITYKIGIYRDNSGIDENTYIRSVINWNSASRIWETWGEESDGSTTHSTTAKSLLEIPNQPMYTRMTLYNNAAKTARAYFGFSNITNTHSLLINQAPTSAPTWGQLWIQIEMSRAAGLPDYLYLGSLDYVGNQS